MDNPTIDKYGVKRWKNAKGQLHRKGGPALELQNGHREWYANNLLHRRDGPAVIPLDGRIEWWLDGHIFEFDGWVRKSRCSPEKAVMMKLKYG